MKDNRLHTPIGVNDILPRGCVIKKEVLKKIESVFGSFGYKEIESPMFEYIEVLSNENKGSTDPKQMYRFFDRDGSTLALRSDMTPPIARIAATVYSDIKKPLRFSYFGNTFKYNENYRGKMCQFFQAGLELMGINSIDADAEIVAVAVKSLIVSGITDFKINIGQVEFIKGILDETGLNVDECQELQYLMDNRDYVGLEGFIQSRVMSDKIKTLFSELPKLVGGLDVLSHAKTLTDNIGALEALENLERLYLLLKYYDADKYVSFDLGMVNRQNYYTGIIFRGYTYGSGFSIIDGGRYDNLVAQFGVKMPAVGFGIKINDIINVIENSNIDIKSKTSNVLFAYASEGKETALKIAEKYRHSGMKVENSFLTNDFDSNFEYAKNNDISHLLYFIDNENIKLSSFKDDMGGYTVDITIDELTINNEGDSI